jgi:hypothetical protein
VIRREIETILDACCAESGGLVVVKMDRMFFDADGISPEIHAGMRAYGVIFRKAST